MARTPADDMSVWYVELSKYVFPTPMRETSAKICSVPSCGKLVSPTKNGKPSRLSVIPARFCLSFHFAYAAHAKSKPPFAAFLRKMVCYV